MATRRTPDRIAIFAHIPNQAESQHHFVPAGLLDRERAAADQQAFSFASHIATEAATPVTRHSFHRSVCDLGRIVLPLEFLSIDSDFPYIISLLKT